MSLCVRVKILEQFAETVNQLKGQRQQTVQTHVCAALCSLLKVLHTSHSQTENMCVYQGQSKQAENLSPYKTLFLSTRAVFEVLWGQKRYVPLRCPSCRGRWRASVLCCAAWLQKVWPDWFRWWETPASPSPHLCFALTGEWTLTFIRVK